MNKFVATIVTASVLFTTGVFSKPLLNVRLRGAEEDTVSVWQRQLCLRGLLLPSFH